VRKERVLFNDAQIRKPYSINGRWKKYD